MAHHIKSSARYDMRDFLPVLFKAGNVSKNNGTVKMRGHQKDKTDRNPTCSMMS